MKSLFRFMAFAPLLVIAGCGGGIDSEQANNITANSISATSAAAAVVSSGGK